MVQFNNIPFYYYVIPYSTKTSVFCFSSFWAFYHYVIPYSTKILNYIISIIWNDKDCKNILYFFGDSDGVQTHDLRRDRAAF